jgi:CDGSH-type Zn-finger protein
MPNPLGYSPAPLRRRWDKSTSAAEKSSGGKGMTTPEIAQKAPFRVDVEAGRTYWWCVCGLSQRQPYCDGSHKAGPFTPIEYKPTETGTVWMCGCKRTGNQPLCDGTHNSV